jgi:hypothetical protein
LREGRAGLVGDDRLRRLAQRLQGVGGQLGVAADPGALLGLVELGLEQLAVEVEDDAAVHRDEAPVRVVREPLVAGAGGQALDALVVEPQVEDGVHHAGHRELGARPHTHQQRVGGVAQLAAHRRLEPLDLLGDLVVEALGPAAVHVGPAGIGGDGEAGRYGELEHRGHLGEVGPLAAEEVLHLHRGLWVLVVEGEDVRHRSSRHRSRTGNRSSLDALRKDAERPAGQAGLRARMLYIIGSDGLSAGMR